MDSTYEKIVTMEKNIFTTKLNEPPLKMVDLPSTAVPKHRSLSGAFLPSRVVSLRPCCCFRAPVSPGSPLTLSPGLSPSFLPLIPPARPLAAQNTHRAKPRI